MQNIYAFLTRHCRNFERRLLPAWITQKTGEGIRIGPLAGAIGLIPKDLSRQLEKAGVPENRGGAGARTYEPDTFATFATLTYQSANTSLLGEAYSGILPEYLPTHRRHMKQEDRMYYFSK
jgi:hypothetical protein